MTVATPTDSTKRPAGRGPRTGAEWVTFTIACALLVALAVVIVTRSGDDAPAEPVASQTGSIIRSAAGYEVPVEVRNVGGRTAAEVQVRVELTIGGEVSESDQVVDFLAGDDSEDLTFVFEDDPADGELVVEVVGYATP
ncbi:MAG: TIGR02588 family protein [Microthrixaceae bacterium]